MVDAKVRADAILVADAEVFDDAKALVSSNLISWLSKHYGLRSLLGSDISASLYDARALEMGRTIFYAGRLPHN